MRYHWQARWSSLGYVCAVDMTPREHFDRFVAVINTGDWDTVRELFAADMRVVDHRPIGWEESVGADASMAIYEGWTTLSPQFQVSAQLLAAGPRANVGRYLYEGVAEHGVKWEIEVVIFAVVEGGQTTLSEIFPGDDAESALARFEEFSAQTA